MSLTAGGGWFFVVVIVVVVVKGRDLDLLFF